MKEIFAGSFIMRSLATILSPAIIIVLFGVAPQIFAHGGEDHGDEKPKVAANEKGIVSRSTRLGDFEVMLKNPVPEPDTATAARLFITKFDTNEAFGDAAPSMEIESSNGAVTQAAIEKTDAAGSYNLKIPALTEGSYTIRINLKSGKGSETATFSGVEISQHAAADAAAGDTSSRFDTILLFAAGAIVLGLFAGLLYFARRMAGEKQIGEEAVSA